MTAGSLITVTEKAAKQIKALLAGRRSEAQKGAGGVRLAVKSRGCSGFSYLLEYADNPQPGDEVVEAHGVRLFIDPKASFFVLGTEMDYTESELEYGFTFSNPNEKGRCGCGESFHV